YGVSGNQRSWYDNSNAERLGYRPQDNSEPHAAAVLAAEAGHPADPIAEYYQGGTFCAAEYTAETRRDCTCYSTESTASGGRPSAALPPETTIGRSTMIGFLTIASISAASDIASGSIPAAAASFFRTSLFAGSFNWPRSVFNCAAV